MNTATAAQAMTALVRSQSTAILVESLRTLAASLDARYTIEEAMAMHTVSDELENRHPEIETALEAWCLADDSRTYPEVVLNSLAGLGII